jgi:hypothetical protein
MNVHKECYISMLSEMYEKDKKIVLENFIYFDFQILLEFINDNKVEDINVNNWSGILNNQNIFDLIDCKTIKKLNIFLTHDYHKTLDKLSKNKNIEYLILNTNDNIDKDIDFLLFKNNFIIYLEFHSTSFNTINIFDGKTYFNPKRMLKYNLIMKHTPINHPKFKLYLLFKRFGGEIVINNNSSILEDHIKLYTFLKKIFPLDIVKIILLDNLYIKLFNDKYSSSIINISYPLFKKRINKY